MTHSTQPYIELADLSDLNILVVGDVMLDQYWFGDVDRISPEAPVPIVNVTKEDKRCGGAANVALNVADLSARCKLISVTGDDVHADVLEQILLENNIEVEFIRDPQYQTTLKQRVIARNQQLIRLDFEKKPDHEILARVLNVFEQQIKSYDLIILSDYGKGGLSHVHEMIRIAKQHGKKISVDPKGSDWAKYKGATIITPNLNEFKQVKGRCETDEQMHKKAFELIAELDLEYLLITLSERGMMLYSKDQQVIYSPAQTREVYDVSGAGDTVIACLSTLIPVDMSLENKLKIANAAAGVVVAKIGTATASREEINLALRGIE